MLKKTVSYRFKHLLLLIAICLLFTNNLIAHGYVKIPFSRAYGCKLAENSNCGAIQYEPQSLEAPSGAFSEGKLDRKLGSVGKAMAAALNEQSLSRWTKSIVISGDHNFTWHFTAPHMSKSFEFYITKPGWDHNKPLTKNDFVKLGYKNDPNCKAHGWSPGQKPAQSVRFTCTLPARTGYQIVLAEWDVADTTNSFYNLIDLDFKGSSQVVDSHPIEIGKVTARTLLPGDVVEFMSFQKANPEGMQTIPILTIQKGQGSKKVWPHLFAEKFNTQYAQKFNHEIRIGEKTIHNDGKQIIISPTYEGKNIIYAKKESKYTDAEIIVKNTPVPVSYNITISGVEKSYAIKDGKATVSFQASSESSNDNDVGHLIASVEDNKEKEFGVTESTFLANQTKNIQVDLPTDTKGGKLVPGNYKLIVTTVFNNITLKQHNYEIKLKSEHPPICPAYSPTHGPYQGGDCVTNYGNHYYCKQYPYSGWCGQSPLYYEPGKGLAWQQAWSTSPTLG